uniref:SF3 helicase domain-containing protein n=1 Tax=viral metagenome TaxID=1070528 RepID=A0A6C0L5U4_9ZZZZ
MSTMTSIDQFVKHPLKRFLEANRCTKVAERQHASMCGIQAVTGTWNIPDEKYDEFLDHMHDYLFVAKGRPMNFVEQPRLNSHKPILIDMDFKFNVDRGLSHQFQKTHISEFVKCIVDGLKYLFKLPTDRNVRFFVSLRPQAYVEKGKKCIKDGIHIQSPDMCLTDDKHRALRAWLLEKKAVEDSFEGVGYTNEASDIYDAAMTRKQGWFFYGESKHEVPRYDIDSVFVYNTSTEVFEEDETTMYGDRELMTLLSVRYKLFPDTHPVLEERKEEYAALLRGPASSVASPAAAAASAATPATESDPSLPFALYVSDKHDEEEIELSKILVQECLSVKRATDYKTWIETGWCLSNIEPSDDMFQVWIAFSKKSTKAGETDWAKYKRQWFSGFSRNTTGAKLTMKSLHYWAREDAPEKYKEIVENDHVRFVQYRVDDTHHHAARILKRMYKQNFCASIESRKVEWYTFDERIHTWRHINQGMELREKLSSEVVNLVVDARMRLKKKGYDDYGLRNSLGTTEDTDSPDSDWFKKWVHTMDGERFSLLQKLEKHLYSSDFKNCVMKEAAELFSEEDFTQRLNLNQYLVPCQNGVIDLNNEIEVDGQMRRRVIFRPGKPDDYMSFMVGRNQGDMGAANSIYYTNYDAADPIQIELIEFLKKIFPAEDVRNYMIRLMSSCLEGANREQCYYTFIGVGGNGKSKLVDLMRFTLGDFAGSLQATALTRKRPDSGAANPDIVSIKNRRFIYLQEPDDKEPLNTSRMKQFSGEDMVEARGLFEDQQRFRITGKLFMMCNRFPPIHAMDRGTWRRIRVITFGSEFMEQSDPRLKAAAEGEKARNIFPRDKDLDRKIMRWREAWLSLLVHTYETEYMVNGLEPVPASVLDQSNKYKESFDMYGKFKAERMFDFRDPRIKLTEFGNEEVSLKDVLQAYNGWVRANSEVLSGKRLTKQELQNRLDEDFGTLDAGIYKRVVVFSDDDEKEDFIKDRST